MARVTTIQFTNPYISDITEGIKSGTLKLEEILDDNNQLKFGTCNSSKFSCTLRGADDLTGEEIYVYQTVDGVKNPIFTGVITSCVLNKNMIERELVAYDLMYSYRNVNVWDWYAQLEYPCSMRYFRDSLMSFMKITQVEQDLCNDSMLISRTVSQTEMSFETVISAICELNGCYGIFNREGEFEYVTLENKKTADIRENVRSASDYELYTAKKIDLVQLMFEDGDVGYSYGEGENRYQVVGNFLLYGKTETELSSIGVNLYSVISDIEVTPCDLELIKTDYSLKLGDRVLWTDRYGNEYQSVVLSVELSGVQFIKESIKCDLDEYRDETTSDFESEIRKLMGKSNVLKRTITETQSTITDIESGLQSQITQTSNSLNIVIKEVGKEISDDYDIYDVDEIPTLTNYPANTWHRMIYPGSTVYPSDTLYWDFTYEDYYPHLGSIAYLEDSVYAYRFIIDSNGQFKWKLEEASALEYLQSNVTNLQITQDSIISTIQNQQLIINGHETAIQTNTSAIEQNAKEISTKVSTETLDETTNKITESYQSEIKQLSDSVDLKIQSSGETTLDNVKAELKLYIKKDDTDTLISAIEGVADKISFNANSTLDLSAGSKLSLGTKGVLTIDSTYFKISETGSTYIARGRIGNFYVIPSGSNSGDIIGCNSNSKLPKWDIKDSDDILNIINNSNFWMSCSDNAPALILQKTNGGTTSFNGGSAYVGGKSSQIFIDTLNTTYDYWAIAVLKNYGSTSTDNYLSGSVAVQQSIVAGYVPYDSSYTPDFGDHIAGAVAVSSALKTIAKDTHAAISSYNSIGLRNIGADKADAVGTFGQGIYYNEWGRSDKGHVSRNYGLSAIIENKTDSFNNTPCKLVFDKELGLTVVLNDTEINSSNRRLMYMPLVSWEQTQNEWQNWITYPEKKPTPPFKFSYDYMNGQYGIHWYNSKGFSLAFQEDCNLVIYNKSGKPIWASYTTEDSDPLP